jgi:Flp pilus assembly protein TadD
MRSVPELAQVARKQRPLCFIAVAGLAMVGCAAVEGERAYRSGTHALERGDMESAVADLEAAVARAPGSSEVHNRLGIAYAAAGRSDDAIHEFESAVALDCDNATARRNLTRARGEVEAER